MKLEHFHYLLEINRYCSISAAARALNIGQMRLSTMVRQVENELGFPIFQRSPRGVALTPAGEQFMALAWEINIKAEILTSLKRQASGSDCVITLLLSPSIAMRLALPLTQDFYRFALPGRLVFEENTGQSAIELILKQHANIALIYLTDQELLQLKETMQADSIQIEPLTEHELLLLVSADHPFAQYNAVSPGDLGFEHLAGTSGLAANSPLKQLQGLGKKVTLFSSFDTMCKAIQELGLVGIVPDFLAERDSAISTACLRFVPLRDQKPEDRLHICLVTCKDRRLLQQEQILIQCIHEYFQQYRSDRGASVPATMEGLSQ